MDQAPPTFVYSSSQTSYCTQLLSCFQNFHPNGQQIETIRRQRASSDIHFAFIDLTYLVSLSYQILLLMKSTSSTATVHYKDSVLSCHCNDITESGTVCIIHLLYIWNIVMSRCLIISYAYKMAIGLPVAAVILIDSGQVGATVLPSDRLCLFIKAAVCPLYPPLSSIQWIYSHHGRKNMLIRPHSPEVKQKHFHSQISIVLSVISDWILCIFTTSTAHTVQYLCSSDPLCAARSLGAYINWTQ